MYKIYFDIDGWNEYTDYVVGIEDINVAIVRENGEFGNKVLREKVDISSLKFVDVLYTKLCSIISNDRCREIGVRIYNRCNRKDTKIYDGIIRVNDLKIKPYTSTIEIGSIYDNGYSSRIDAAKNQKTYLNAVKTRNSNNLSITLKSLLFLDAANAYTQSRVVWDVLDVLKFLVAYATDNKCGVVSSYLTSNNWYITTVGQLLQLSPFGNVGDEFPEVSIENVLSELYKALRLTTQYDSVANVLTVEQEEYFYDSTIAQELPIDISDTIEVDTSKDYETISIGSETYIDIATLDRIDDYADSGLNSFKNEEINACGACNNRDSMLDLVNQYIIDTDYIKTCIVSPIGIESEDFSKIVLIHGNATQAITTNNYYNISINNYNKATTHLKYLPTCFTKYYNANGDFKAYNDLQYIHTNTGMGVGSHLVKPFAAAIYGQVDIMTHEVYDEAPSGYDNSLCIFNNNSGGMLSKIFNFETLIRRTVGKKKNVKELTARVDIFWVDNTFLNIKGQYTNYIIIPKKNDAWHKLSLETPCIDMIAGDNVSVQVVFYYSGVDGLEVVFEKEKTIFQSKDCGGAATGIVNIGDSTLYNSYIISNKGSITNDIYSDMRNNPKAMIAINGIGYHILELKYNYHNGNYTFRGITKDVNCCYNFRL